MNTGRQSSTSNALKSSIRCIVVISALFCASHPVAALNTHARLSSAPTDVEFDDREGHPHQATFLSIQHKVLQPLLAEANVTSDAAKATAADMKSAVTDPLIGKSTLSDTGLSLLQFPETDMPEGPKPVPTVVRCIVIMSCQFLVVHIALAMCRTLHELIGTSKGRLEAALSGAAQTFTYGPMLCALFMACHMRVKNLSHGKDEPPEWMQTCMYVQTLAVLASAMLVFAIQLISGTPLPPKPKVGPFDLEALHQDHLLHVEEENFNKVAFYTLTTMRYLVMFALFGGLVAMILGILSHMPHGAKHIVDIKAPEPAIMCTMILSVAFFASQLIVAVCRSYVEFTRVQYPQVVGMLHAAATTTEIAPMLAVLFLACHMRAFQHYAPPQDWAQSCMLASTGATCVMSLLAFLVPLSLGGVLKTNTWTNTWASEAKFISSRQQTGQQRSRMFGDEVAIEVPSPILGYIFMTLRYFCMLCVHGGAAGVIISIIAFESPGPSATMPASPSLQCVVNLTGPFFFVYFIMTLMLTISELNGGATPMERWRLFSAVEAARSTLALAPVLSLIFVAMRLLEVSLVVAGDSLQSWVSSAMAVSTWSLQVSGLMCLVTGLIMAPVQVDSEGKVVNKFSTWHVGVAMVALRYVAMLLLYGGVLIVMMGMFTSTAATESIIESAPVPLEAAVVVF